MLREVADAPDVTVTGAVIDVAVKLVGVPTVTPPPATTRLIPVTKPVPVNVTGTLVAFCPSAEGLTLVTTGAGLTVKHMQWSVAPPRKLSVVITS